MPYSVILRDHLDPEPIITTITVSGPNMVPVVDDVIILNRSSHNSWVVLDRRWIYAEDEYGELKEFELMVKKWYGV